MNFNLPVVIRDCASCIVSDMLGSLVAKSLGSLVVAVVQW